MHQLHRSFNAACQVKDKSHEKQVNNPKHADLIEPSDYQLDALSGAPFRHALAIDTHQRLNNKCVTCVSQALMM